MTTSVSLSPEIEERLSILAKETGRAKSFFIKRMVEDNIETIEDFYLAEATLERILSGKEQIHTGASVREQLGLGD